MRTNSASEVIDDVQTAMTPIDQNIYEMELHVAFLGSQHLLAEEQKKKQLELEVELEQKKAARRRKAAAKKPKTSSEVQLPDTVRASTQKQRQPKR